MWFASEDPQKHKFRFHTSTLNLFCAKQKTALKFAYIWYITTQNFKCVAETLLVSHLPWTVALPVVLAGNWKYANVT